MGIDAREDNKHNLICNRKIKNKIYIFVLFFFKQRICIKNCLQFHVRTQRNRSKNKIKTICIITIIYRKKWKKKNVSYNYRFIQHHKYLQNIFQKYIFTAHSSTKCFRISLLYQIVQQFWPIHIISSKPKALCNVTKPVRATIWFLEI